MKPRTRAIIAVAGVLLLILFAWKFSNIVSYILGAGVLSLMGAPMMRFLGKFQISGKRLNTTARSLIVIVLFFAIAAGFISLFAPLLVKQANVLTNINYVQLAEQIEEPLNEGLEKLKDWGVVEDTNQDVEEIISDFLKNTYKLSSVTNLFNNILGTTAKLLGTVFAITFILFFFLKEEGLFYRIILGITPDNVEEKVENVLHKVEHLLSRYFLGLALQVVLFTIMVWLGLNVTQWLGFNPVGSKNALLIGFLAGIMNLIPYIGPIIGGVFAMLISLSASYGIMDQGEIPAMLLAILIVFAIAQTIDNVIFQPIIFGTSVKAHPLEIFIVILIAGSLGGIIWMILAIPAYTFIRVVAKEFLGEFKVVQKLTQDI